MSVILRPIVTEKATNDSELKNCYSFYVNVRANKIEIKKAVQDLYGVQVLSVRTTLYRPKVKSKYTKSGLQIGVSDRLKRAVVKIADGQEIDLYSNI